MGPKWFIFILLGFIGLSLWNGMLEQSYIGASETGTLATLMSPLLAISNDFVGGIWSAVNTTPQWIGALWTIFWFDYAQFHGEFAIFRIICLCFSGGILLSLILTVFRGSRA